MIFIASALSSSALGVLVNAPPAICVPARLGKTPSEGTRVPRCEQSLARKALPPSNIKKNKAGRMSAERCGNGANLAR